MSINGLKRVLLLITIARIIPFIACFIRFTIPEDTHWFVKSMGRVALEEFGEEFSAMVEDSHYFVDFLRYKS